MKKFILFLKCKSGASAIELGSILGLVVIASLISMHATGITAADISQRINNGFNTIVASASRMIQSMLR